MCTSKLILEGAVKCRKPFLVRLTVRTEHYSELQRVVFLEGLTVAEMFKVIQDSYGRLSFIADNVKYSEPAETSSHTALNNSCTIIFSSILKCPITSSF